MLKNLALRQQLSTVLQKRRPRIGLVDRAFWVVLRRVWARWADAVAIVRPSGWSGGPGSWPEDGARERVGRSADPRRVAEAGVHGLRAHRLALHAKARAFTGTEAELAHVPPEPPGGDGGHGLLHGADSDLPRPVRLVRDQAFPARDRALERHGESHVAMGGATAAGAVPVRRCWWPLEIPGARPGHDLLRSGSHRDRVDGARAHADKLPEPVAERSGRAIRGDGSPRPSRPRHCSRRRASSAAAQRVPGVLSRGSDASRGREGRAGRSSRWNSALQVPPLSAPNVGSGVWA